MTRRSTRRWWTVVAVVTALGVLACGYASAWERRTAADRAGLAGRGRRAVRDCARTGWLPGHRGARVRGCPGSARAARRDRSVALHDPDGDASPELWGRAPAAAACAAFGRPYDFSFVLLYLDRLPVPLVLTRSGGLTSGTRTRMDHAKPYVVDVFVQRFEAQ